MMYFVVGGTLSYTPAPMFCLGRIAGGVKNTSGKNGEFHAYESSRIGESEWLSEPTLWTNWDHQGDFTGIEHSRLLTLAPESFIRIVGQFPVIEPTACVYARKFVVNLNRYGQVFTDHLDLGVLFDERSIEPKQS